MALSSVRLRITMTMRHKKSAGIRYFTDFSIPSITPFRRITQLMSTKTKVKHAIAKGEFSILSA